MRHLRLRKLTKAKVTNPAQLCFEQLEPRYALDAEVEDGLAGVANPTPAGRAMCVCRPRIARLQAPVLCS